MAEEETGRSDAPVGIEIEKLKEALA